MLPSSTLGIGNVSYSLKAASARNSSCDDVFHLSALDLPRKRPMSHPVNTWNPTNASTWLLPIDSQHSLQWKKQTKMLCESWNIHDCFHTCFSLKNL